MGAHESIEVVRRMLTAARTRDAAGFIACFTEDAVLRQAGVPSTVGGMIQGRGAILDGFHAGRHLEFYREAEVRQIFADESGNVCVVRRVHAPRSAGSAFIRAGDRSYTTHDCAVYRVEGGCIRAGTLYCNWVDVFIQSGVLSPDALSP